MSLRRQFQISGRGRGCANADLARLAKTGGKSHAYEAEIQVTSADEVLYGRVLDALGYSQNREPFAALAKLLNWEILKAFAEPGPEQLLVTEAMMFGTAGLLPLQRTDYSGTLPDDERSTHLAYIWGNLQFPSLEKSGASTGCGRITGLRGA